MRLLGTILMCIGGVMVAIPATGVLWVWFTRLMQPGTSDIYYVVTNGERMVLYFRCAIGFFAVGLWLRRKASADA